jgi:hypothetical protein
MQKYRRPPKPEEIWDGKFPQALPWRHQLKSQGVTTSFSGGSGTLLDPWLISTPWDLAQIPSDVAEGNTHTNEYFKLTCDIYLNYAEIIPANVDPTTQGVEGYDNEGDIPIYEWKPIGGAGAGPDEDGHSYCFKGNFDGDGHTIYNAFYNQSTSVGKGSNPENEVGIFGDITNEATIKNLNTKGGYIGGNISVGGIIGRTWGGKITNCHNENFVYGIGSQGAGGVAGTSWVYIPDPDTDPSILRVASAPVIDKCSNKATVVSNYMKTDKQGNQVPSGSGGGLVGENEGSVINSWNEGEVSCLRNAGGIVGSNQNSSGGDPVIYVDPAYINNCYNTGDVGAFAGVGSIPAVIAQIAGGIMGYQTGSCQNVYNIGNITAPATGGVAGQIIGELNIDESEGAEPQTNDDLNYFAYATPANVPVGIESSGYFTAYSFDASELAFLTYYLNLWVSASGTQYYPWIQGNDGFPVLNIPNARRYIL